MQKRIAKRTALQRLVVSGCVLACVSSLGCKTGMSVPGASMLGFKKSPSAETLAGQGPSTTYPVTPGNDFTPNAIASKTAGTGGTADTSVPQSAAAANGYASTGYASSGNGAAAQTPPSYAASGWGGTPTASTAAATTQPTVPNYAAPNYAATTPSYNTPSSASVPNYGATVPNYGATTPNYAASAGSASAAASNPYSQPSAYTAPTSGTAANPYSQPAGNYAASPYGTAGTSSNPYATPASGTDYSTPSSTGYQDPQAQGARVAGGFTMPSTTTPSSGGTQTGSNNSTAPATYRPGSTAGATAYPNTPYTTPNGSMYR